MGYKDFRDSLKTGFENFLSPFLDLLYKLKITPNMVTWFGVLITLFGAFTIYRRSFIWGALIILFSSIFDLVDGALARKTDQKSRFGGFLDSTTDRISEGALFLALLAFYLESGDDYAVILCYLVMFLGFMVSYLRARAGGLKIDCSKGLFTRSERMFFILLGLLTGFVKPALVIIALGSLITVIQRFMLVNEQAKNIR